MLASGETVPSPEITVTLTSSKTITLTWTAMTGAASYNVYRGTASGGEQLVGSPTSASFADTGYTASSAIPAPADTSFNRYYISGDSDTNGYPGGIKYQFNPQEYARLVAGLPAGTTPFTATDAEIAPFAGTYYQYNDSYNRVTLKRVAGDGNSATGSGSGATLYPGQGIHTFSYGTDSGNPSGWNSWSQKVTETLPNGDQNISYYNDYDEVILLVYKDNSTGQPTSGKTWCTYTQYDQDGRVTLTAQPSAFISDSSGNLYSESLTDLVGVQNPDLSFTYTYLSPSQGMIATTDYNSDTASVAPGYVNSTYVQTGTGGTPIEQESETYTTVTSGSNSIYPLATDTVYGGTGASDPRTTTYTSTYSGLQLVSQEVQAPPIVASQNGPASSTTDLSNSDTTWSYFDSSGRTIWTAVYDPVSTHYLHIGYTAYDGATGAVTEQIVDVNTSITGDYNVSTLPSGWSNTAGLNLVTSSTVDSQGRPTEIVSPNGNDTYIVNLDATHETRTYTDWHEIGTSGNYTTTGQAQVSREVRPTGPQVTGQASSGSATTLIDSTNLGSGFYVGLSLSVYSGTDVGQFSTVTAYNSSTHTLTFSPALSAGADSTTKYTLSAPVYEETIGFTPVETTSTPSGAESLSASNILSLSRSSTNSAGQTVAQNAYSSLSGVTYSTSSFALSGAAASSNTAGNNFSQTLLGYSAEGLQNHAVDGNGTVTDSFFDGMDRLTTKYIGTNDSTTTGAPWIPGSNGSSSNNMLLVEKDYYDQRLLGPTTPSLSQTGPNTGTPVTEYVQVTFTGAFGESIASSASTISLYPSNTLQVNYPTGMSAATGYNVYVGAAPGAETLQNTSPVSLTPTPTNWNDGGSLTTAGSQPPVNEVGDGNLTEVDHPVTASSAYDQVTQMQYDQRDRLIATKVGSLMNGVVTYPMSYENDGTHRLITFLNLDNLGEVVGTYTYAGDSTSLGDFNSWTIGTDASKLRSDVVSNYDDQGRVYSTVVSSVDQSAGTVGASLTANNYFDHFGNEAAQSSPGGQWTKHVFDGANRDIQDSTTDGGVMSGTAATWANAMTDSNDIVLQQTDTTLDADGNPTVVLDRQRFDNDPATGSSGLGDLTGPNGASATASRDSYTVNWYDAADRMTDSANLGSNGGQAYTVQTLPPARDVFSQGTATGSTTTLVDTGARKPAAISSGIQSISPPAPTPGKVPPSPRTTPRPARSPSRRRSLQQQTPAASIP